MGRPGSRALHAGVLPRDQASEPPQGAGLGIAALRLPLEGDTREGGAQGASLRVARELVAPKASRANTKPRRLAMLTIKRCIRHHALEREVDWEDSSGGAGRRGARLPLGPAPGGHLHGTRSAPGRHLDGTRTAPARHPVGTWTAPTGHPEGTRTAPGRHPEGTRTAPGRHPQGTPTAGRWPAGRKRCLRGKGRGTMHS